LSADCTPEFPTAVCMTDAPGGELDGQYSFMGCDELRGYYRHTSGAYDIQFDMVRVQEKRK